MDVREKYVMQKVNKKEKSICPNCIHHNLCIAENNQPCFECNRFIDAKGVTVQEWISVKDRLPENDHGKHWKERKHYLVRLQNGIMVVARYGYKDYGWWIDSHDCVLDKERYREVTHWMPLPEAQKGE